MTRGSWKCLINLNNGQDDEGCLKFCNILKWSATVQGKLLKGCLDMTVHYNSISMKVQWQCQKYYTPWSEVS